PTTSCSSPEEHPMWQWSPWERRARHAEMWFVLGALTLGFFLFPIAAVVEVLLHSRATTGLTLAVGWGPKIIHRGYAFFGLISLAAGLFIVLTADDREGRYIGAGLLAYLIPFVCLVAAVPGYATFGLQVLWRLFWR